MLEEKQRKVIKRNKKSKTHTHARDRAESHQNREKVFIQKLQLKLATAGVEQQLRRSLQHAGRIKVSETVTAR